jgi:membrane protein
MGEPRREQSPTAVEEARIKGRLGRMRDALQARASAVWRRDRALLHGPAALANRSARVAILVGRGIVQHRLGLQSAALTYYTVFSLVPVLVVVLWIRRAVSHVSPVAPVSEAVPSQDHLVHGNSELCKMVTRIFHAVQATSHATTGVLGLLALLYAITRLFRYSERALDIIAASERRPMRATRLLGYLALLILPPAVLVVSGLLVGAAHRVFEGPFGHLLGAVPGLKVAGGAAFGLGIVWLGITIFYSAAGRARIAFASAAVGGAFAAVGLPVVLWAFAEFQIGASRASATQSGLAAGPVFLLWVFSSWYVVLIGAEIAVAHGVERILIHGATTFHLDGLGEQEAGVAIMMRAARGGPVTVDGLARDLRLPPHLVRPICLRLAGRGLLRRTGDGFTLARRPDDIGLPAVLDAVERDPGLDAAHDEALATLGPETRAAVTSSMAPPRADDPHPSLADLSDGV